MVTHHPDLTHAQWRKSARSSSSGQNCVEVATNLPDLVAIRDSKDPEGPKLVVSVMEWREFVRRVHDGQFEL
jgi:Domain of unknown function (DUF397)